MKPIVIHSSTLKLLWSIFSFIGFQPSKTCPCDEVENKDYFYFCCWNMYIFGQAVHMQVPTESRSCLHSLGQGSRIRSPQATGCNPRFHVASARNGVHHNFVSPIHSHLKGSSLLITYPYCLYHFVLICLAFPYAQGHASTAALTSLSSSNC